MNYLEEYRKRYGGLSITECISKPAAQSDERSPGADIKDLLSRYLDDSNDEKLTSGSSSSQEASEHIYSKYSRHRNTSAGENKTRERSVQQQQLAAAEDDDDEVLCLPTTCFNDRPPLTVDVLIAKQPIQSQSAPTVRHKTPGRRSKSNPLEERQVATPRSRAGRLHSSFTSGNRLVSESDSYREDDESDILDLSEISPSVMIVRSDSQRSMKIVRRRDSNLSTNSRGSMSREEDILELSDEEFDEQFGEGIQPAPGSPTSAVSTSNLLTGLAAILRDLESQQQHTITDNACLPGVKSHHSQRLPETCPVCKEQITTGFSSSDNTLHHKCNSRVTEQERTIREVLDSEVSYCNDLVVIKEQFCEAMIRAELLTTAEATVIFGNTENLLAVSRKFIEQLRSHLDKLGGDCRYRQAKVGKLFCESSAMFLTFEAYCLNYNASAAMIDQLRTERVLLNLFLEASQNDNPLMRRIDLKSFLMIPIQRVMKYPLLLQRLHKATADDHPDKSDIESAIQKLTSILLHINSKSKLVSGPAVLADKTTQDSKKKTSFEIALTKLTLDTVGWSHDEIHFLVSGKIGFLLPTEGQLSDKIRNLRFNTAYAVIVSRGHCSLPPEADGGRSTLMFADSSVDNTLSNAAVLIIKKSSNRLQLLREPFYLSSCIVSRHSDFYDIFEIQENIKDSFIIRPAHNSHMWYRYMTYYSMVLGGRNQRRRRALPNILLHT